MVYRLKDFVQERGGMATVELALSIMLLLTITLGVIELGRLYHAYHLSDKALRDAARFLARQDIDCTAVGTGGDIENDQFVSVAKHLALTGTISPVYLPTLPDDDVLKVPASPPANELLLASWSDPNSISVTVTCVDKINGAITGGEFFGAYASEPFVPVVQMTAIVPFDLTFLGPITDFTVSHSQVGIGDQYADP